MAPSTPPPTNRSGSSRSGRDLSTTSDRNLGEDGAAAPVSEGGPDDRTDPRPWGSSSFPGIPWTRMLFIGVICFALWLVLDAPSLQHSATVSPLGTRRTVSLDVVGPLAAVSRGLGLSHMVGWTDEALGRSPGGGPSLAVASHNHHSKPPLPGAGPHPVGPAPPGPMPSTTTTTTPVLNQHPTAANPLRVLVIGDSIGLDLGQPLVSDLAATGVVVASLDGRVDTGLSRPDYFDWPAELRVDLLNDAPQLVVVMLGANDPQSLVVGGSAISYGTPAWNAAYGQRVGAFIDEANAAGARVLWVGMPPMAGPQLNGEMQDLNSVVQSQVAARPGRSTYLASASVLADGQGNFTAYLPNGSGAEVNIRTPDGIHLAPGGGERLSQSVLDSMRSTLHIDLPA